ncbi:hypothetical protein AAVH_27286 [Aphelenchoides avenae]|nr:hypothetical protein AAVH_27286 [Aphelenchus avenae]
MSANGNTAGPERKCPCREPFFTGAKLPIIFSVCDHSVCAVCVYGPAGCPLRLQGEVTCPLCRQLTSLQSAANAKCSRCGKNEQATDAFACKTCTVSQKELVLVCGACGMRAHKSREVVEYDALAKAEDIDSVMQDERQHNDAVQRQTSELTALVASEMERISKDYQVDVDVNRPLSLTTKEEHERHAKESTDRRLRSLPEHSSEG